MLRKEILYNNLILLLKSVRESQSTLDYIQNDLQSSNESKFIDFDDSLLAEINTLERNLIDESLFTRYDVIKKIIDDAETDFVGFNILRINEIRLIMVLSKVIAASSPDLTESSAIMVTDFQLVCMDTKIDKIPVNYFSYINTTTLKESVVYFSLEDYLKLEYELNRSVNNLMLLFILLSKIGDTTSPLIGRKYVLLKNGIPPQLIKIKAALYLHIVSSGKSIHETKIYGGITKNNWVEKIDVEDKYQQFFDTIYILSEYNSVNDLIGKYLRLYQIIEDFMFKYPLVVLEKEYSGKFFSIRDFKKMYKNVSESEQSTLEKLFTQIFKLNYHPSTTFKSHIVNEFTRLPGLITTQKIEDVFRYFGIKHTYVSARTNITSVYPILIYSVRNSIVHNKTTENHLTYSTITPDIVIVLEKFLIPTLEDLVFFLTSDTVNTLVRFQNPYLEIWEDN